MRTKPLAKPAHWKLYNGRALLHLLHWHGESRTPFASFYCRVVDSFVYEGTRIYEVRAAGSGRGDIVPNTPIYQVSAAQLRDTGRRVYSSGDCITPSERRAALARV